MSTESSEPSRGVPSGVGPRAQETDEPEGPLSRSRSGTDPGRSGTEIPRGTGVTRAAAVWVAVAISLAVLVLLIIFFIQNQDQVRVYFLGLEGSLALGIALFIAAVGGGILVALAGGARIIQLRIQGHRRRKLGNS
ncbi:LapA family protein [Arthrobacter sp. A5]|uniref:LapA family protein n=1 Tax=Arthrobacter sp. A5 TaxID=576926 RepID=UPI003DA9A8CF